MGINDVLKPKSKNEINSVIDKYMIEFEELHLPTGFKWRKGQKEAVEQIIQTYLEGKHKAVILDAPVGAGKSLIATAVSFILNEVGKRGYVLASEISLQDQYEQDIDKFKLPWGSVKGIDNYICTDNDEKHSLGTCKIRNLSPPKMSCYEECPYFSARNTASEMDTAVLNYNYWLIMQTYVKGDSLFPPRDFTICDEAHKVLDIIQNHYSPRFSKKIVKERLERITNFFINHNLRDHTIDKDVILSSINELQETEDQDTINGHLISIEKSLKSYKNSIEILKDKVDAKFKNQKPPKDWRKALFIADWIKDLHCKIEDYNFIISQTSTRNIVKNPSNDKLVFNCLEERFLMDRYFYRYSGFTVLMSATFADPLEFMKTINLKGAKYIKVENSFSFEKSPIYYYPKRRMSYKYIEQNREWLNEKINEIMDKHKNESGIIHSASYDLTNKIRENLSLTNQNRLFIYEGTEEKRRVLDMMKISSGRVLMGPSLTTGLDMKDDLSRFAIIAKIPYPSLSDRFIKTKMKINPAWYEWKTILEFLQSIGRTVRHENDWAVTYILDGSLSNLIHNSRKSFPPEFFSRIKIINEDI